MSKELNKKTKRELIAEIASLGEANVSLARLYSETQTHQVAIENRTKMLQGEFSGAFEYTGLKSDGTLFDIEVNGEFIKNSSGEATGLVFVTRDFSERKLVQARIRR